MPLRDAIGSPATRLPSATVTLRRDTRGLPHRVPFFGPDAELGACLFQGIFEGFVPRISVVAGVARAPLEDVTALYLADLEIHQRLFHGRGPGSRCVRGEPPGMHF